MIIQNVLDMRLVIHWERNLYQGTYFQIKMIGLHKLLKIPNKLKVLYLAFFVINKLLRKPEVHSLMQ